MARSVARESVCKVCGCDDNFACVNGCYWHEVDRRKGSGICSNCVGKKAPRHARYVVVHEDGSYCVAVSGPKAKKNAAVNVSARGSSDKRADAILYAHELNRNGACKGVGHVVNQVEGKPAKRSKSKASG